MELTCTLALLARVPGRVAIGFGSQNTGMSVSNIIIGYVNDDVVALSNQFSVGRRHSPDVEQGGVNNILDKAGSESDGKTTIEFIFPLNSGDSKDHTFETGNI